MGQGAPGAPTYHITNIRQRFFSSLRGRLQRSRIFFSLVAFGSIWSFWTSGLGRYLHGKRCLFFLYLYTEIIAPVLSRLYEFFALDYESALCNRVAQKIIAGVYWRLRWSGLFRIGFYAVRLHNFWQVYQIVMGWSRYNSKCTGTDWGALDESANRWNEDTTG